MRTSGRPGDRQAARPASPSTATAIVPIVLAVEELTAAPAGQNGPAAPGRYDTQWLTPRSTWSGDAVDVVTAAVSVYCRNGGALRARSSSGPTHQVLASATPPTHQAVSTRPWRLRRCQARTSAGSTSTPTAAAALTPLIAATASADSNAYRRGGPPRRPTTRGASTHGSRTEYSHSAETEPTRVRARGDSAYASAATCWAHSWRRPSRRTSTRVPT